MPLGLQKQAMVHHIEAFTCVGQQQRSFCELAMCEPTATMLRSIRLLDPSKDCMNHTSVLTYSALTGEICEEIVG